MDKEKTAILLLNLGGPDSLKAVRPFLYNLFSDRDIIRLGPSFLQKPLAWLISTIRSKKTMEMYSKIGGRSPILEITAAQAEALEKALNDEAGSEIYRVYTGMRYWHPFTKDTLARIKNDGIRRLIVLSLYPHYSKATTGSSVADFKKAVAGMDFDIRYIEQWPEFPPYIDSLAELIAEGMSEFRDSGCDILYSAHSLPRSFIDEGDPYLDHIEKTIGRVNERVSGEPYHISGFKSHLSFQSKTGPVKWLEPSTEETIVELSKAGCKNLFVIPISFVSDHIETLYEIDILYHEFARQHGINMKRCRSLNTSEKFILAMKALVMSKLHDHNLSGKGDKTE